MDELEISGKRYISSRRAAKENKYHTDYIGQLIRAGRIVGTKVGRAWYVEVDSLEKYLGGDVSTGPEMILTDTVAVTNNTVQPEHIVEHEAVIEVVASENEALQPTPILQDDYVTETDQQYEVTIPIQKYVDEGHTQDVHISKKTLQYVYDDTPLLPEIRSNSNAYGESQDEIPARGSFAGVVTKPKPVPKIRRRIRLAPALALSLFILSVAAACSLFVSERLTVESGGTASVGYIFLK